MQIRNTLIQLLDDNNQVLYTQHPLFTIIFIYYKSGKTRNVLAFLTGPSYKIKIIKLETQFLAGFFMLVDNIGLPVL